MRKKILFLDFDGVINRFGGPGDIAEKFTPNHNPECVANLNEIFDAVPDAELVITSSWRVIIGESKCILALAKAGVCIQNRPIGFSPSLESVNELVVTAADRSEEIAAYLNRLGGWLPDYVVLDDWCSEGMKVFEHRFVQTELHEGLTAEQAQRAIHILKGAP